MRREARDDGLLYADFKRNISQLPQLHFRSLKNFLAVMCSRAAALFTTSSLPSYLPIGSLLEILHHVNKSASLHHQVFASRPLVTAQGNLGSRFTTLMGVQRFASIHKCLPPSLPRHHHHFLTLVTEPTPESIPDSTTDPTSDLTQPITTQHSHTI
jgi:hypothetical protein